MSKSSQSFFNWFRRSRGFGQSARRVRGNVWLAGFLGLMSCLWLTAIAVPITGAIFNSYFNSIMPGFSGPALD